MGFPVFVPLLLAAAAPVAAAPADESGWSWCVADATGPAGKVRFFSDPFEGETDVDVEGAFREYVDHSYTGTRKTVGYAVSCRFFPNLAAAAAALKADSSARANVTDVMTGWRFHFE